MCPLLLAQSHDPESQLKYYNQVLRDAEASSLDINLEVVGKGKGVVASRNIDEGVTVFTERPLVNLQHLDNHASAIVCQACLRYVGSIELQIGHKLRSLVDQLRGAEQGGAHAESGGSAGDTEDEVDLDGALEAGERLEQIYAHVTPERIAELCSGAVTLPLTDGFRLPKPMPCRRGCGALYCSAACEAEAWEHSHCLLCTGTRTSSSPLVELKAEPFWEHARETNEIFLLAAQVVVSTLLRAARLLAGSSSGAAGPSDAYRSALLAAWQPYMYGWKRCWWDSVAVPDDVDDEEEFRTQLKSLASDSLELLSAAISDPRFGPELLQLEVYGSIVGMFELNNMGLSVPSPVEDYFLAVDEMEEGAEKQAVLQITQPLLDALDSEYASPCESTAFLALQSCINHSCDPNCTAVCDTGDRTVTVLAQRDIAAGEEITLSYIDVTLPYKERQAALRDYGFVCRCTRCVADAAAARSKRQGGAAKGFKVGRRR
ncbi:SET and zf-MYND domain-containing protein [Volvox carteri f. nagariensis]|uniref:SET and zf-MYND domain-containing protein n=1 Tax=Volvox carteri f. nagariensis TaxID=3068 RepID=D8U5L8_VOLCA|nr:SET and zf-MYND domain-containing protein [Volvox carteri f. nagariensis]EFJ45026.1 SET and zf-MYND domain-containing protein [Volvox carteri f. nagariensis]|eukprot:XP_002953997.1 SET and zf-MYND domain-containing protein [Volvox carteri f. nagariensis]